MKMTAADALLKELELWGIDHIYGIPGSSLNGMMAALSRNENIQYVQVRQEGAGAMAASADYKFTGKIGAAFGSGGPGASNMINGLYDAKMDRVPMLAIVAQSDSKSQNTDAFQEFEALPLYRDVSVYNRKATTAAQIPHIVSDAIRAAYQFHGVGVVILHNDLMEEEIEYKPSTGATKQIPSAHHEPIDQDVIRGWAEEIRDAKAPLLYLGMGAQGYRDLAVQVAEEFHIPVVTSAKSIGFAFPSDHPHNMGSFGRLGTKPAFEAIYSADLIFFVGSNHPFARFWPESTRVIQVNNDFRDIGKQLHADASMLADVGDFLQALLDTGIRREDTPRMRALIRDRKEWNQYLERQADRSDENGIYAESVLFEVKKHATENALFGLGVGNNKMHATRILPLDGKTSYAMSAWFATLGFALPAAMAAQLSYPDRQVWSIQGDGGFAMNMQEILTMAKYQLPITNIVMTDQSFGFIEHSQRENLEETFGVDIQPANWAMAAEGMGALGFEVKTRSELEHAFQEVDRLRKEGNRQPILIDAKIIYEDPLDTARMGIDPNRFSPEEIQAYVEKVGLDQPLLGDLLKDEESK